jgi:WD40 repeat protein
MAIKSRTSIIDGHAADFSGLVWSPDGEQYVTAGSDGTCHVYDVQDVFQVKHQLHFGTNVLLGFH